MHGPQLPTSGASKVCGAIRSPQHLCLSVAKATVKKLQKVVLEAVPWLVHVPVVEARIPCAKLCMHRHLESACVCIMLVVLMRDM